jgi:hypothetical protein
VVFPFLAEQQRETAQELLGSIRQQRPAILHLVVFPRIELNHTLLVFGAEETPREIRFEVFDPNHPEAPLILSFRRAVGAFSLPRTAYFAGGKVHAYEIYDGLF